MLNMYGYILPRREIRLRADRAARRWMDAADCYGSKTDIMSVLNDTVMMLLAAPSTPDEFKAEFKLSERTAYNMMQVAQNLDERFATVASIGPKALHAVPAKSA